MHCPKCKDTYLKPTKLEDGLPVMSCSICNGSFLSLLYYRDWAERVTLPPTDSQYDREFVEESDTKTALLCPKCSRLMTKYLVVGTLNSRIDLCGNCDEAWLDGGEWQLLKSLELANKLPVVFTDQWQRRLRQENSALYQIDRLKKIIGEEDTEKSIEVKKWLVGNSMKSEIIRFLMSD